MINEFHVRTLCDHTCIIIQLSQRRRRRNLRVHFWKCSPIKRNPTLFTKLSGYCMQGEEEEEVFLKKYVSSSLEIGAILGLWKGGISVKEPLKFPLRVYLLLSFFLKNTGADAAAGWLRSSSSSWWQQLQWRGRPCELLVLAVCVCAQLLSLFYLPIRYRVKPRRVQHRNIYHCVCLSLLY